MDLFGHVIDHFLAQWGYITVFGMLALEGLGLFFIPGETTLIAAAIVAGASNRLGIAVVLLAALGGALVGDNSAFLVGRRFGFGLIRRYGPYVRINQKRIKFVQVLYLRYGRPIVFAGRFVALLRCWESFLAGANGMPWRKFAPVNAAASVVWVSAWGLGAYWLGTTSKPMLESVGLGIFAVVCALLVIGWIYFRRNEQALEAKAEQALPGPLRAHRPRDVSPDRDAAAWNP